MARGDLDTILRAVASDGELWMEFFALCDCGGRQAGTPSEVKALQLAQQLLTRIGSAVRTERIQYSGWRLHEAALTLEDGTALTCNPLLGSQSSGSKGLTAEVCDLGRGVPDDFARLESEIPGRIALVRHEYPFSPQHIHRRRKLGWAMERGAAGFIIANPSAGEGPVSGSSGRAGQHGIPAVGTDFESALRLSRLSRECGRVRLHVRGEDYAAETSVLILDVPGRSPAWVVLSAHIDGHDFAESAMDNATGVAVAIAAARALAPHVARCNRGLRVCLFSAEEWALAGSKAYLDRMSESERRAILLNVNLDTVAGDDRLTALTSEFPRLDAWVRDVAREHDLGVTTYPPMMSNSDHYNFARHGIPALRLLAGFDRPDSNIRHILTRGDTRDRVRVSELTTAACTAATLMWRALTMSDDEIAALT